MTTFLIWCTLFNIPVIYFTIHLLGIFKWTENYICDKIKLVYFDIYKHIHTQWYIFLEVYTEICVSKLKYIYIPIFLGKLDIASIYIQIYKKIQKKIAFITALISRL